ncbi:MAG: hypothetical protein WCT53_00265 [Candidatus Gracilibacteria bacterium]
MKKSAFKNHSGLSLLVVVLVIAAVAVLLASTAGLTGIDAVQTSVHQDITLEAFAGADSCMEVAIKHLHDDHNYVGETATLGDTVCTITITGSGTARTVKVHAAHASSTYTRELQAEIDWGTKYQVMSWQELTD